MNTYQLEYVARHTRCLRKCFQGVYASDMIPKRVEVYPAAFIFNSQPSSKPGEHWVAIYFDRNLIAEYFDSFGFKPRNKKLISFMNANATKWRYSTKLLQYPFSLLCGQYCLYFLVQKCRKLSLKSILSAFSHDTEKNDKRIKNFMKRLALSCRMTKQ